MKRADDFNQEYLAVHTAKENLFWTTYMGVEPNPAGLEKAEIAYKEYISNPARLVEVREAASAARSEEEKKALRGWESFFGAHGIESPAGRELQKEVIALETELFRKRAQLKLHYRDASGNEVQGSTNVLAANIAASDNESVRKTSHEGLLALEQWILANGYIELVKKRNEFARALGFPNYFDYRVRQNEHMSSEELFQILTEFEALTRDTCASHLKRLAAEKGKQALLGHNVKFAAAGDAEKRLNPYLPFRKSLEMWSLSFARLGITYRGATLHLDLFDRKGKYENGFMHAPGPCYLDQGKWVPARINFTSNATPNQVGSGRKALLTLFHEGGHAAHFSNILMNAACFSQEYPPTSMAYAETQSMFCDSLANDGDWLKLYARDASGAPLPDELIRFFVTNDHPFTAFQERSILLVPYFEGRLYAMKDSEMTPERLTALARQVEKEVLGIECSPRPVMAIPHLLGGESACSYQGYLLANMAVYQTRAHFLQKYGYLADNPKIGPDLAKHYWAPGNSKSHKETIQDLTGHTLSGRALADFCNRDSEELWQRTRKAMDAALERRAAAESAQASPAPSLDAKIHVVHGTEEIANNLSSMEKMWADFEAWVGRHYPE